MVFLFLELLARGTQPPEKRMLVEWDIADRGMAWIYYGNGNVVIVLYMDDDGDYNGGR